MMTKSTCFPVVLVNKTIPPLQGRGDRSSAYSVPFRKRDPKRPNLSAEIKGWLDDVILPILVAEVLDDNQG